jgi:acetyltransferase-like isoleucine patch superfamily enzyme
MKYYSGKGVKLGKNVEILPNAFVGDNCEIGDGTVVQYGAFLEHDCTIGNNCRIGTYAVLRRGTRMGDHSVFGSLSASEGNNNVGNHVTIETQCHITEGTVIEDYVFIASEYVGANTVRISHGRDSVPLVKEAPYIRFGARIGVNVTVLPKITIGREALIGAGAVVTSDIPDFAIAFGTPAKVRGKVAEEERYPEKLYQEFLNRRRFQ